MRRTLVTLIASLALHGAAAEDKPGPERLVYTAPGGWERYRHDTNENMTSTEYVPSGQANEDWEEMLTVQRVIRPDELTIKNVLAIIAQRAQKLCEDFAARPVEDNANDTYPSATMIVRCGKNKGTGRGELMLARGFAGRDHYYIVQKSWRVSEYDAKGAIPVPIEDRSRWLDYLAALRVCDTRRDSCPAPP